MEKYGEDLMIRFHYADWRGRLLVKALCDLFNDVANMQTIRLGFDVPTLNAMGLTWMLHRMHIRVRRMPKQGEMIRLDTWPTKVDRLFALRDFRMTTLAGEELVAASSGWMVIDMERRRPVRLPALVTDVMSACGMVEPQLSFSLDAKLVPTVYQNSRDFVATYDNIDFNKHVTQATYVRWLTNALPYSFLKAHEIREIELIYEHEIMPDSEVHSENAMEERDGKVIVFHRLQNVGRDKIHAYARSVWAPVN